ncbi:hypothetical protein QR680_018857 [Steinernema hermaphroditum]|uniref:Protein-tyrosine-phosphatase n=1 Tax=Steinernema hermaphroditum TaxID=289476 RepID=A0AA39HJ81_9BILA|nr:hypothetical protein QR680_018857 [Steinernema hermaphroditum]
MAKSLPSVMAAHFAGSGGAAFRQFCNDVSTIGLAGLREQFAELKSYQPSDPARNAFDANSSKNRYKDVICLDSSRIVLKPSPQDGQQGDYIHANVVRFDVLQYHYVCAQGPLDTTVADFWRMIWQEKVVHIFMLCRCEELGKSKCSQYWPKQEGATMVCGGFVIRNEKIHYPDKNIIGTNMSVTYQGETRGIDHRQWVTWPDKTVPRTLDTVFKLLSLIRDRKTPTLVHCSAGIGRTGTLVSIDVLYRYLMMNKPMSLKTIVENLRNQRGQAVQTEDQYLFIHYVIMQRVATRGFVDYSAVKNFCQDYESYILQLTKIPQDPLIRLPTIVPANYQPPSAILAAYKTAIATMKTKSAQSTQGSVPLATVDKEKEKTVALTVIVKPRTVKTKRSGGTKRTRNATRRTRNTPAKSTKLQPDPACPARSSSEPINNGDDNETKKTEGELPLVDANKKLCREIKPASKPKTTEKPTADTGLGTARSESSDDTSPSVGDAKESGAAAKAKDVPAKLTPVPAKEIEPDYEEPESVFVEYTLARESAKETLAMSAPEREEAKAAGVDSLLLEPPVMENGRKNSKEYTELNRYLALQQKFAEHERKTAAENRKS